MDQDAIAPSSIPRPADWTTAGDIGSNQPAARRYATGTHPPGRPRRRRRIARIAHRGVQPTRC